VKAKEKRRSRRRCQRFHRVEAPWVEQAHARDRKPRGRWHEVLAFDADEAEAFRAS